VPVAHMTTRKIIRLTIGQSRSSFISIVPEFYWLISKRMQSPHTILILSKIDQEQPVLAVNGPVDGVLRESGTQDCRLHGREGGEYLRPAAGEAVKQLAIPLSPARRDVDERGFGISSNQLFLPVIPERAEHGIHFGVACNANDRRGFEN